MSSTSESLKNGHLRRYQRAASVVFLKTNEQFGGLSNMAGGFPIKVNGLKIGSSEALYQACRFPHRPKVQQLIIQQTSPMTAKMKSKRYRSDSRPDWEQVRTKIMRWCLRVKLAQNWGKFSELLLATGDRPIVEQSRRDDFWGAQIVDDQTLVGMNVLGRLLMELREEVRTKDRAALLRVEPLALPDFLLDGLPIQPVVADDTWDITQVSRTAECATRAAEPTTELVQTPLFNQTLQAESAELQGSEVMSWHKSTNNLRRYATYKDSGVLWLGDLPTHWHLQRAKWLFRKMDRPAREGDEVVTCFRDGIVTLRKNRRVRGFTESVKEIGYQGIRRGDLVIHAMDAFAGAAGVSDSDGKGTPVYAVLLANDRANANYYGFLVREMARSQWIGALAKGIRERSTDFRFEGFASEPVPVPPLIEQSAIVRFLDYVDWLIRRYIIVKQKLIKLLEEQKRVIIHRAVTHGLDPNVRLKPSGVGWLGDVPEHWEVLRISRFARVGNGSTPSRSNSAYWNGGTYPWLNSSQVNRSTIDSSDQFVTRTALEECHLPRVRPGSVLIAITGQGKTRGTAAVLRTEATINQHIAFITPRTRMVVPEFLQLALVGAYQTLRALSDDSGSTKGALTCEDLKRFRLAIPPQEEQVSLATVIGARVRSAAVAIADAEREITLLREYRTRLIADVVTGKLDVREAAAKLPTQTEEFEGPLSPREVDEEPEAELTDGDVELQE